MTKNPKACASRVTTNGRSVTRKELSVILIEEDEVGEWENEIRTEEIPRVVEELLPEVALNSVIILSSPKTMKLLGMVDGREVVVMIDPGATHNFISHKTVEELA